MDAEIVEHILNLTHVKYAIGAGCYEERDNERPDMRQYR
jgi:hypothetical protein